MVDLIAEQRAATASHALALAKPMIGIPMCGDPHIVNDHRFDSIFIRRAIQYAATILQRDPQWAGDLSHLKAQFRLPAKVEFISTALDGSPSCRSNTRCVVVAVVCLPRHVMDFNPSALPLLLSG